MSGADDEMSLFLAASEQVGEQRERLVAAIPSPELRNRVLALLRAHDALGEHDELALPTSNPATPVAQAGVSFDGFTIQRELGRGGMGVVYLAEQANPRRPVAIKTLHDLQLQQDGARLQREAHLLARLQHPGIAQVHGSGRATALGGAPYLVLEFVDGVALDRHVQDHGLSTRARLTLLAQIAAAVAHAHARGVVHRDLKPGNVLVTSDGRPKVLDFGIARLVQQDGGATLVTRAGQVLGTLPYMSPEQVLGDGEHVDVRTDVYALGAMAYELLAGALPVDVRGVSLATATRRILEVEPLPLGRHHRALRGDVELVVGKALEKDPNRRYASAAEFAADLHRLLAGEPVLAHAKSHAYRLHKLVLRHRVLFAALAAGFVSLTLSLGQALRAKTAATAAAEREALRAEAAHQLSELLAEVVDNATPQRHGGKPPDITQVVDELAERLATSHQEPWVQARAQLFFAQARQRVGRLNEAAAHVARAQAAFAASALTEPRDHLELATRSGRIASLRGEHDVALRDLHAAHQQACREFAASELELGASNELALALLRHGDATKALPLIERAVELARTRHGKASAKHATAQHNLALALTQLGRHGEAIAAHERVVAVRRSLQPNSLALATALQNLGHALQLGEQTRLALDACREAIGIQRRVLGATPTADLAFSLDVEGSLLRELGQRTEALLCFAEAADVFERVFGTNHTDLAICLTEWGVTLIQDRRANQAAPLLERALQIYAGKSPSDSPAHAATLEAASLAAASLAATEAAQADRAVTLADRALQMRRTCHGADHVLVGRALEPLCSALLAREQFADCERHGRALLELRRKAYGDHHWVTWSGAAYIWVPLARRGAYAEGLAMAQRAAAVLAEQLGVDNVHHRAALAAKADFEELAGGGAAATQPRDAAPDAPAETKPPAQSTGSR